MLHQTTNEHARTSAVKEMTPTKTKTRTTVILLYPNYHDTMLSTLGRALYRRKDRVYVTHLHQLPLQAMHETYSEAVKRIIHHSKCKPSSWPLTQNFQEDYSLRNVIWT